MTDAQHYDVLVVGTGADGGTLAHRLAPVGGNTKFYGAALFRMRPEDNALRVGDRIADRLR
ncbi:hypothetical protein [Streptomyces mirabilis]|uniref:hypothetical protein n=1 Tax=Streptomyces mirabilis TaxID=68239 RepID=UPI0036DAAB29